MNFKEYLEKLNAFAKENPESLGFVVVSSSDDEGNSYNKVHYDPSLGHYDGEYNGDWHSEENIKDEPEEYEDDIKLNSVCIN